MTRTCPFENRSHMEFTFAALQSQTNLLINSILKHCAALNYIKDLNHSDISTLTDKAQTLCRK